MRRAWILLAATLAVTAPLAGCVGKSNQQGTGGSGNPSSGADAAILDGWVFDDSQLPIEAVNLTINAANASALTDASGHYAFAALPTGIPLVLIAQKEGFEPRSASITLAEDNHSRLNFTLPAVAVKAPYSEVKDFRGKLSCQAVATVEEDNHRFECGAGVDPANAPLWEFTVAKDTAGIVIEVTWESGTALADDLNITVETVGFGDADMVLTSLEGPNVLRAQVNSFQAAKFYSGGGTVRVTMGAATNIDDEEVGVGGALAFQQDYDVFASIFYIAPPQPDYTYFQG